MINKFFFICLNCLFLVVISQKGYSQNLNSGNTSMQFNNTADPSGGKNFRLHEDEKLGVDLYTGRLEASLPIYTLESSDLKIPISIDYTAGGGVKPQDLNTTTGLGWALNAGGSISRTVRGLPDETANGYIGTNNEGATLVYDFNNQSTAFTAANNFNNTNNSTLLDGEPDIFYIQTPFFSIRFTIDQNGNPVTQGNLGYKIIHSLYKNSANATNTGIEVIDDHGTQYFFGSALASRETATTMFFGQSFTYNSTWYLDKIVTYNSKDIITLSYLQGKTDTVYNYEPAAVYNSTFSPYATTYLNSSSIYNGYTNVWMVQVMTANWTGLPTFISTIVYNQPKYVNQIVTKLGEADFTYTIGTNKYINTGNPPELTSITIKQYNPISNTNSNTIETFGLNFLELQNGIQTAPNETQPPYIDNSYWCNDYRRLLQNVTVSGGTAATSSPITLFSFKYNQDYAMSDRYLVENCDYWGFFNNPTFSPEFGGDPFFTNPDQQRTPYTYQSNNPNRANPNPFVPMSSILSLIEVDNLIGDMATINYEPNSYFDGTLDQYAGGSRVYNITHTLPTGEKLYKNYNYGILNQYYSTGQLFSDFYRRVSVFPGGFTPSNTLTLAQSLYNIADNNGIFIGYSAVEVQDQNGGYEINNFTNYSDYPDIITSPTAFIVQNEAYQLGSGYGPVLWGSNINGTLSSFSYKRGLLKSKLTYTATNNKISETDYTYGSLSQSPTISAIGAQNVVWKFSVPGVSTSQWSSGLGPSLFLYNSNIENWCLTQVVDKKYDQNNPTNFIQKTTNYTYDNNAIDPGLVKTISTTDSKNATDTKTFYYADDVSIPMITSSEQTALNNMIAGGVNRINVLIHEIDNQNGAVHVVHNSYTTIPANSLTSTFLSSTSSYAGTTTSTTLTDQKSYTFDLSTANLISTTSVGSKYKSVLYGYNSCYPVAAIENASSPLQYFFEGFEANTSSSVVNNSTIAHTGNNYWNGNYTVNFSPLLVGGHTYLIQWWNLVNGKWNFNEQPYSSGMSLVGPLDDIRIFPSDGLMTTYTYDPMVGKTSETDPSGRSTTYQYDGLNRLNTVRDNDGNILKQYCYAYNGQAASCVATPSIMIGGNFGYIAWNITFTSILTGISLPAYTVPAYVGTAITLSQIPAGNYNIVFTPQSSSPSNHSIYFNNNNYSSLNGSTSSSSPLSISNVPITNNMTIWIDPQ
jgi:YD repeat-containing protein